MLNIVLSLAFAAVPAMAQTASAAVEQSLDLAELKRLILRVRAGDDAALSEFKKIYIRETKGLTDDTAETLADESVEFQNMVAGYIMLSLAEARGSRNARAIRDMLFEGEKFDKLAYAQNVIGERFEAGEGVPQDDVEAVKWFRLAAAQGDPTAQLNLGWQYHYGGGVPKDVFEAVHWFRLSAVSGNPLGQLALGVMYEYGLGIREDDAQAVNWYTLAAEQGQSRAQNNLGVMYAAGEGVPEDDVMAVKWYRAAAMQDVPAAQLNLGRMYRDGEGVGKDLATAYAWLLLAMEGEDFVGDHEGLTAEEVQRAQKDFRRLRNRLSPAQRARARELASRLLDKV